MDEKKKAGRKYYVYKHISPSGKVYIGITSLTPSKRWNNGNGYRRNAIFSKAIKKYGWDNIKHEILFDSLTKEEACQKEIELIALYKSNIPEFGYNVSNGGGCGTSGVVDSEETRKKKSVSHKGENNYLYGKHLSAETKEKLSKALKGRKVWNDGVAVSEEHKRYLSEKVSGANHPKSKRINQYTIGGELINTFGSIGEASKSANVNHAGISLCCSGKLKQSGGFVWRYAE